MRAEVLLETGNTRLSVDLKRGVDLAIPLRFDGDQPRFFSAPPASRQTLQTEHFRGNTQRGGSCNVDRLRLTPHCNGTHTECVGHVVDDSVDITDTLIHLLLHATLISIAPEKDEQDLPAITAETIGKALPPQHHTDDTNSALIVRTLPNASDKAQRNYDTGAPPAYFTVAAMRALVTLGVDHLLVDIPSVDPMHDDGKLSAHRVFWGLPPDSRRLTDARRAGGTITELIFVPNHVPDGRYLLNLQIPPFCSDAAPSRPIIYAYDRLPR